MNIDTKVFERIVSERRQAAVIAVTEALSQTYRFGAFSDDYIKGCAEDLVNKIISELHPK